MGVNECFFNNSGEIKIPYLNVKPKERCGYGQILPYLIPEYNKELRMSRQASFGIF